MADRLKLHEELCGFLDNGKAWFNPPASVRLTFPGIIYSLDGVNSLKANDQNYKNTNKYRVTVIDPDPDSKIYIDILEHFQMCSFDRFYVADNLNHWVLTLYY